ncbi:hypothetical protein N7532_003562 [Penicillium argentinense]|uniref:Uncharacterized protein n=1 Tax=Penicillium argentinense TaxID=1131581 RepID=A0A9W9KES1_9EURO|nr:uncharacterized protein N7532_003562 [Penicillium argentinense]KAJ5103033.1 hypothetical protein N7532_003562 [Penicillium argentinense]
MPRDSSPKSVSTQYSGNDALSDNSQPRSMTSMSGVKQRLHEIRKKWGPLMAAKEHLDDEYTFPPGRYAGQGRY